MHWHGLRLENRYDGVPHETQDPIPIGGTFTCQLRFPDAGFSGITRTCASQHAQLVAVDVLAHRTDAEVDAVTIL